MDHQIASVKPNGMVTWFSSSTFVSSCLVRVRYFPFDKQYCRLIIASWAFDNSSIRLKASGYGGLTAGFIENGVWDLTSAEQEMQRIKWDCCEHGYEEIHYLLIFSRQSRYYVITVIVPSATLSMVSLLVFFMPPYSEEKVSLASSNLLAMLLFQELVSTSMPPIGTEFPLIGSFFVASIVINTISIFTSILTMYIHKKHSKPVPMWLKRLALLQTSSKQYEPSTTGNWVVRRLSGLNWAAGSISGAVTTQQTKVQRKGSNLLSYIYHEPTPPIGRIDEKEEAKLGETAVTDRAAVKNRKGHDKTEYSKDWQAVALKLNRLVAFLLTAGMVVTASVIVFLYINQREEDFPART
ncbi:neuronal acetylcholine receptor subunit alpha-10-like [Diadema antillarum]|uniref:neuronal acetylcholine receptor subunit alpha-10-like n=1 Tax=Diadema antillarum TaxID=105358 RepID=UPI003A836935